MHHKIFKYTSQDIEYTSQDFDYTSQDIAQTSQDIAHTSEDFRIKQRFTRHNGPLPNVIFIVLHFKHSIKLNIKIHRSDKMPSKL